ncbi:MAG: hypothetical protein CVU71_07225 [Deltaproteobacteria bacterium HGW-Deltaproteobacteria-6]|jgi:hypothetical protein|nr:MAG: hypothetical protein CVU71_07225 [Deltaproteobacteria bacterium HGW-Deltaproteobacteria-6]
MHLREENFRAILYELIDENPFAVRPLLKIMDINFTESVKTLAVTCEARPVLKVNLSFVNKHCRTDRHVKALICHEFLHVLLHHTEHHRLVTPLHNLAFDAVINAIIHRTMGWDYSSMMSRYYAKGKFPLCLLCPPEKNEIIIDNTQKSLWDGLYQGSLIADDILDVVKDLSKTTEKFGGITLDDMLGNHFGYPVEIDEMISEVLNDCLRQMNGHGIWRNPGLRGVGMEAYPGGLVAEECGELQNWMCKTMTVLRTCLVPDKKNRLHEDVPLDYRLPLMNEHDKRAYLRGMWSPFIPDATWDTSVKKPIGAANIYLDVSGSMKCELPHLIALLVRLRAYIWMPFWAFSDIVARAFINKGQLVSETTGGTSINCVLEHIIRTRPRSAVIVTDGYIEQVDMKLLSGARATKIHAIVSRNGDPSKLSRAGIPYTQLEGLPL